MTAVRDAEQQPSPLVDLVALGPGDEGADPRLHAVPAALDLRALVARLRVAVEDDDRSRPPPGLLAHLAAQGWPARTRTPGAGTRELSSDEPLWSPDGPVPLSPSKVELASTCALALGARGGGRHGRDVAGAVPRHAGARGGRCAAHGQRGRASRAGRAAVARAGPARRLAGPAGQAPGRRDGRQAGVLPAHAGEPVAGSSRSSASGSAASRCTGSSTGSSRSAWIDGRPLLRGGRPEDRQHRGEPDDASRHPQLGLYQAAVDAGGFDELVPGARSAGATLLYVGTSSIRVTTRGQSALSEDARMGLGPGRGRRRRGDQCGDVRDPQRAVPALPGAALVPRAARGAGGGRMRWSAEQIAEALHRPRPTPEQRAVIEAPLEPMLVVAGAGSGKTETMAARVVWLIANELVAPDAVLGLTFTRKAAGELSERVRARLAALRRRGRRPCVLGVHGADGLDLPRVRGLAGRRPCAAAGYRARHQAAR